MRVRWLVGVTVAACLLTAAILAERWQARRIASGDAYWIVFDQGGLGIGWCDVPPNCGGGEELLLPSWRNCSWVGFRAGKTWIPRSAYPEILARITGQRLPDDPAAWDVWLAAHPDLVWDEGTRRLVEPWRETTIHRLPDDAKPVRVSWKLNLEGCARPGQGLQVCRTVEEFRGFLDSCSHRYPIDLLLKWNAIDFSRQMAVVAFGGGQDPSPRSVATVFEKDGALWVTELEIGKPHAVDKPLSGHQTEPAVILSRMGGVVLSRSNKPVKAWVGPLPMDVTREALRPSRSSP